MRNLIFIVTLCTFVAADQYIDAWKKAACQKNVEFSKGLAVCFELKDKEVQKAIEECISEIFPSSDMTMSDYATAGCQDDVLFEKMSECYRKNELSKEEEKYEESVACYLNLFKKYEFKELEDIYKKKHGH